MNEGMKIGDSDYEQALILLGKSISFSLLDNILDNSIKVNNYFIFSTGELSFMGKKKTVTFGVLNHVFISIKADDLTEFIEK